MVEARQDTTAVIHPLSDHRRQLPLDKKGELIQAHPGYQSLMKDLKQSTKQRFVGFDFDYPAPELEATIIASETGINLADAVRLAIECFEDARVEALALRQYAGLRRLFVALHPTPQEGACNPSTHSCLRHRLSLLSRALLAQSDASTAEVASLALSYRGKTRLQSDQLPDTWLDDTVVDYRDDNRHLWRFHVRKSINAVGIKFS